MTIQYDEGSGITNEWGTKEWRFNGKLHKLNGPAIEHSSGGKYWYKNGQYHRTDGPACEYPDGDKFWFINDQLHRLDGPACEYVNGDNEWYLFGEKAIRIHDQNIVVGEKIEIRKDVGIVLNQTDTNIYLVLLGSKKIFIRK